MDNIAFLKADNKIYRIDAPRVFWKNQAFAFFSR